ncbi:DUF6192 family protein [Streptomyces sp. NPDC050698]
MTVNLSRPGIPPTVAISTAAPARVSPTRTSTVLVVDADARYSRLRITSDMSPPTATVRSAARRPQPQDASILGRTLPLGTRTQPAVRDLTRDDEVATRVTSELLQRPRAARQARRDDDTRFTVNRAQCDNSEEALEQIRDRGPAARKIEHTIEDLPSTPSSADWPKVRVASGSCDASLRRRTRVRELRVRARRAGLHLGIAD